MSSIRRSRPPFNFLTLDWHEATPAIAYAACALAIAFAMPGVRRQKRKQSIADQVSRLTSGLAASILATHDWLEPMRVAN